MTYTTLRRRTILQFLQIFLTDARTFTTRLLRGLLSSRWKNIPKPPHALWGARALQRRAHPTLLQLAASS